MENALLIVTLASTSLLLLGLVAFLIVSNNRIKKHSIEQLNKTKNLVEHQRQMIVATVESIEKERNRIGTELHDSIGAVLSTIKLNLQIETKERRTNQEILKELNRTISTIRTISHQMMPIVLKKYGLMEGVQEIISKVNEPKIIISEWEEIAFSEIQALMLFRIIQESLTNIYNHAYAKCIDISLTRIDHQAILIVKDDGVGFEQNTLILSKGMGLLNMESRAQTIDSDISFYNDGNGGAVIKLVVPID